MDEIEKIKQRYESRKVDGAVIKNSANTLFSKYVTEEREKLYASILKFHFKTVESVNLLEIGAGGGANLSFFNSLGINLSNIYANELLESRVKELIRNFPTINHFPGDALAINSNTQFDVVFQSTVFTSILDGDFKQKLASKIFDLTKIGGIVLWYDFIYDNPNNKDVKGVTKKEVRAIFPDAKKITFRRVTVAPPIGRRIGRLYGLFNFLFPFLRTHIIAVIEK